jgi:hypothetical protein
MTIEIEGGLSFAEWLVIAEGVDANIGDWIKAIVQYARPEEKKTVDTLVDAGFLRMGKAGEYELRQDYESIVKAVLKEKRKEDMNWLAFSLGYLSVKAFRREDLEMAVDQLERMKSSGELPRADIGRLGWMQIGASMQDRIADYKRKSSQLSKTKSRKMAERGEISPADAHLIRHVAKEGEFDLYYLPSVSKPEDIEGRQRLLCKYGKDTQWCTAAPGGTYHKYYSGVGIFILHSGGKPKYQFVDCGDVPERERDEDEDDHEEEDGIAQFMDVNDNSVTSLSPREQKFLSRQANISCYDLAPDGFEDMADFDSSSDERVRASSGSVVAQILSVAGDRIKDVVARLGPALSKMNKSQVYWLTKSESWSPSLADSVLDALGGSLRGVVSREEQGDSGMRLLMAAALSLSSDPASKVKPLAGLIGEQDIEEIFKSKPKDGDGILKSIVVAKKQLKEREVEKIVSLASDVKGMLTALGGEVVKLFSGNPPPIQTSKLLRRKDGSLNGLSRFIEDNVADLPPNAAYWAVFSSPDREATAKRMLSAGLDDERIKILFSIPEVAHLADDSHIRRITKSRSKKEGDWEGLAALANRHGNSKGDERLKSIVRFLKNSDELEGHEVMSAVIRANQDGQSERLVELLPQEIIDLMSLDDINKLADEAEQSCRPSWASPNSKEREGCYKGRPLVAVMKRTRLNFPMDYARFMKRGAERDGIIAEKIKSSDWKGSMMAMNLADDKDLVAELILRERGEKIAPGEIASIIANSKDKIKFIKSIGDKINLLSSKYERPYDFSSALGDGDDWMDWLTSIRSSSEIIGELLRIYKKPLGVKSTYNIISKSANPGEIVRSMSDAIRGMDAESYGQLKKMSLEDGNGNKELMALIDDARHGDIEEGDTVVPEKHPRSYISTVPDEKQKILVGKQVYMPMESKDGKGVKMRYKVVGLDGGNIMVSFTEPSQVQLEGGYRVEVTPEWVFKSERKYFARP